MKALSLSRVQLAFSITKRSGHASSFLSRHPLVEHHLIVSITQNIKTKKLKSKRQQTTSGRKKMAIYILLSTLTDEGWKTVKSKPERIKEVNKEIEAFGAKVIYQYATLGPFDFVNVVEAPDNKTIARVSVELGSRGTVKIKSLPAIPIEEFIATMKKK
jgi:uncharacterized protein with GYD domain